jgi:signal transduction histidine kinase
LLSNQNGRLRVWAIGASLLVVAGSVTALAYEAAGLDRSHRAAAAGVLRDYSAFAADQFARLAAARVAAVARGVLEPVACRSSRTAREMAALDQVKSAALAAAACPTAPRGGNFFEIDTDSGRIAFTAGPEPETARRLAASLPLVGSSSFRLVSDDGDVRLVGFWRGSPPDGPKHLVGFVAAASMLRPVFDAIVDGERLLPGSLTPPAQNRHYFAVEVIDASGRPVYRSGDRLGALAVDRPIESPETNMIVRLGLNEASASQLLIGGLPASRLPTVLALLGTAVGLLAIGGWQMQRERRLAQMRVDFVRSASHELRTPLAQIRMFTETLQLGRVRSWEEVTRSLEFVDQQSRRLSRLVENLLTFAHRGRQRRPDAAAVDLGRFLADTAEAFQPIIVAAGQQLRVEVREPSVVRADREWLTQVVTNLLDNATKYGPAGQTISVTVERGGTEALIVVADQGPGVPPGDRTRIFAPFVRLSREHEERTGGTGIGLAVAAELVAAMHGRIWADEAASGGRFVVALPIDPSEARSLVA